MVTNSAVGSFVSSERGRKLTELVTIHDMLAWTGEQRRLEKAIFFTKLYAAALDVCAAARLWYLGPSRTSLLYRCLVADTRAWPDNDPPVAISASNGQAHRGLARMLRPKSSNL